MKNINSGSNAYMLGYTLGAIVFPIAAFALCSFVAPQLMALPLFGPNFLVMHAVGAILATNFGAKIIKMLYEWGNEDGGYSTDRNFAAERAKSAPVRALQGFLHGCFFVIPRFSVPAY